MFQNIIMSVLIATTLTWFILQATERRRVINGFTLLVSTGALIILMLYIGQLYEIRLLMMISGFLLLLLLISIPILYIAMTITMISTGVRLIKREGLTLTHILSFLMGIGIIISSIILPFIKENTDKKWLIVATDFFLLSFSYFVMGFIIYASAAFSYKLAFDKKDKDFLIVLGAGLSKDRVTPLLAARIDAAIKYYKEQEKKCKIIMSGGQGPDEVISEAQAMKNYALEQNIPEEDIIMEDKSTNTRENLLFSSKLINSFDMKKPKAMFFTSNYHVFRAGLLSRELKLDYQGRGANTKLYYSLSAFIREYIGMLYMNKNKTILGYAVFVSLGILYKEVFRVLIH